MQLSLVAVTILLALSSIHAEISLTEILSNLQDVAALAIEVYGLVDNLDLTTILTSAPEIIDDITQIVSNITEISSEIGGGITTSSEGDVDESDICNGLDKFLGEISNVTDTITDKADTFSGIPFGGALSGIMGTAKDGIQDFGTGILSNVPSCNGTGQDSLEKTMKSFETCITKLG
ncbi:hypothetical protein B0T10DRAFT_557276 [Thelonectria olida]|uniref:Uncharacterized protein n=1 Tax=Thelonectria olida TaxID=1576542 RepID=A0A9P9AXN2_9HYPO|nr:hypothetical protein B0T10DRAFT_557276 [Thelonectria olida]